jgi:hypothetical protein
MQSAEPAYSSKHRYSVAIRIEHKLVSIKIQSMWTAPVPQTYLAEKDLTVTIWGQDMDFEGEQSVSIAGCGCLPESDKPLVKL